MGLIFETRAAGSGKLAPELAPDAMGQSDKAWDRCSARN